MLSYSGSEPDELANLVSSEVLSGLNDGRFGHQPESQVWNCRAGVDIAMGNTAPQAKAADLFVADNNHDGVAQAIETILAFRGTGYEPR